MSELILSEQEQSIIKNSKVSFLIPCYGGAVFESFFVSMVRNLVNFCGNKLAFTVETIANESLVTRARNNLIAKGMANADTTHLMFIDADIEFTSQDIFRLIAADKDVIGGLYPKKTYPVKYVINPLPGEQQQDKGIQEVKDIGTGFLLIKRDVIEKMFIKYYDLKYLNNLNLEKKFEPYMYALFDTWLLQTGEYLSEDYAFCKRWRDMGGRVYAHNDVKLGHSGYHTFS